MEQAITEYGHKSKTKIRVVTDQILIQSLRLGLEEAGHPWSCGDQPCTADELFNPLVDIIISLAELLAVPSKPLASLMPLSDLPVTGKTASIDMREESAYAEKDLKSYKI